jgi:hypothetical protein
MNRYPLVFSDTGTYLSQAIERYLGWDRPAIYSLFMLPLHLTLTTWPVTIAQALLTGYLLGRIVQILLPGEHSLMPLATLAGLSVASALPWFVSMLMPDLATGLLVPCTALLVLAPHRLGRTERLALPMLAALLIGWHLTNGPIYVLIALFLIAVRRAYGATVALDARGLVS